MFVSLIVDSFFLPEKTRKTQLPSYSEFGKRKRISFKINAGEFI